MKRIILLITVTTVFILGSSAALAAPKEGKGKPDTAGVKAEKGEVKAPKTAEAGQEKVKAGKEKAEKEVKAVKEKVTDEAEKSKGQAEKKAEEVKKDKGKGKPEEQAKAKGGADDEASDSEKAEGKGKGKEKSAEAKGKPEGKGLGKDQKAAAMAKQMQQEDQKHAVRQARLAEMLKVAQDKGDDKAVGRIQSLIDKEKSRYEKKSTKTGERAVKEKTGDAGDETADTAGDDAAKGEE